jgi:uncharacterized protein with von Willebrand factor type A (vWA) domain
MASDRSAPPPEPAPAAGLAGGGPYRYTRWDGRQRLPELAADDVLDAVADDLLSEGELSDALARLFERGMRPPAGVPGERLAGLGELRRRLARARQELLARHGLGDVLAEVRRELEELLAIERRGIERRLGGANMAPAEPDTRLRDLASDLASRRQAELDRLPAETGGRIRGLEDYDFLEPDARQRFDALLERLQRQMLGAYFEGLSDAIRGVTPDQLSQNREMVRDLNRLLQQRLSGNEPDVADFLARHGAFFPGARTLDDIIDQLAQRMSAMQSLMASLGADQRQQVQELLDSLLRDDRLRWDLAQLAGTLDQLLPNGLGERFDFHGPQELSLEEALQQLARLSEMDRLADRLEGAQSPAALQAIDPEELGRLLEPDAAGDLRALQQLSRRLEEAGYAERRGDRLQLTPRGSRRLGQRVLDQLFSRLQRDVFGGHERRSPGAAAERTESSRPYEFGRPFEIDLRRTLANAMARPGNVVGRRAGTSGRRLSIEPSDFEVHDLADVSRAATVLLVDMSRSMLLRGCFLAAKKVAMALDMLIRTQYPRDELRIVGFAYYAREIRPAGLASLSWQGYEYGTNLQHGLMVARQLLARSHAANREIVVITDGEPTAHFEHGQVEFSYPPTRRTIQETLREVGRCTREGITINTFMLERSRALTEFVERMTRQNRGRAFYATPEHLGEYVLVDYVDRRRRST